MKQAKEIPRKNKTEDKAAVTKKKVGTQRTHEDQGTGTGTQELQG